VKPVQHRHPDIVLCDLRMPVLDGFHVLEKLAAEAPETPVIVVSGTEDMDYVIKALRLGAWDYIIKPVKDEGVLRHAIDKSLERAGLLRENRVYREHLEQTNKRLEDSLRQLEEDEHAARRIQFQLLPPERYAYDGFTFSRFLKTSAYLSGDFVDYFAIDHARFGFYIADVSGHGVSSAFVTVLLKSTMNYLLEEYRKGNDDAIQHPDRVLQVINQSIVNQDFGKYLTMFYGVVDREDNVMTCANAGQFPFPILFDGEQAQFLEQKNLPVGLFENATYATIDFALPERFVMALFSDGVLEVLDKESLSEKKAFLLNLVQDLDVCLETMAPQLESLLADEPPPDDVTLLLVSRGGDHAKR